MCLRDVAAFSARTRLVKITRLPKFDYYLDESDADIVFLRRQDGSLVAAFSAQGATREGIVEAAQEDYGALVRVHGRSLDLWSMTDEKPPVPDAPKGWEISELLRRPLESLPLQPGAAQLQALSELKPQVEVELSTLTLPDQHRRLSEREHRQESALRDLLAVIEEMRLEDGVTRSSSEYAKRLETFRPWRLSKLLNNPFLA